jgi:hypothetical protein
MNAVHYFHSCRSAMTLFHGCLKFVITIKQRLDDESYGLTRTQYFSVASEPLFSGHVMSFSPSRESRLKWLLPSPWSHATPRSQASMSVAWKSVSVRVVVLEPANRI